METANAPRAPGSRIPPVPLAWRATNRLLTREIADCAFGAVGAARVGGGLLHRLGTLGFTGTEGKAVLRRVRAWDDWPRAWEGYAASLHADATAITARDGVRGEEAEAWRARHLLRQSALALFVAQLLVQDVPHKRDLLQRSADRYGEIAPLLDPPAFPVALPYDDGMLPGYLSLPAGATAARPALLVVFFNGGSSAKEEVNGWRDPFLAHGFATLALDNPGTGAAWGTTRYTPDQRGLLPAVRWLVDDHPALDGRIAVVGISLGGMLAVSLAADAPDLAAVVAVTPPFAPAEYVRHLSPLTQWEISHVTGYPPDCLPYLYATASLAPRAPRLTMPTLVVGAGRDRIVPPGEARRLYAALVPPRTLHWYPRASHCAFSHLPRMLTDTARWLARVTSSA